jgi:hypothetical protein
MTRFHVVALAALAMSVSAGAQDHSAMDHSMMHGTTSAGLPTLPGQDAYGAIAEVVRLLQADPSTDWSKVNIEALRQHLIDMNDVTLRSRVTQTNVPAGLKMVVTGEGRTEAAIRRMTTSHGASLASLGLTAVSTPAPGGAIFTVTATDTTNTALIAQLRGLGFAGIMTLGNHHAPHHLAIAAGQAIPGHAM